MFLYNNGISDIPEYQTGIIKLMLALIRVKKAIDMFPILVKKDPFLWKKK